MRNLSRLLSFQTIPSIISSRSSSGKYGPEGVLDPKYNKVFLKIFGSEKNKSITKKFITDVTGLPIADVWYPNRYLELDIETQADGIVDVLCKTSSGEQILIEIQKNYQRGFGQRMLYYGAKLFSNQLLPGQTNDYSGTLKNFVGIGLCHGGIIMKNEAYISHHMMLDIDTLECELKGMEFHFIDLKKFPFKKNEVGLLQSATDAWCFYLKFIHQLDGVGLSTFMEKYPFMEDAIEELQKFSLTKEEYENYLLYCMGLTGSRSSLEDYTEDAVKQCRVEIAKKMREKGDPIEKICQVTGLRKEDFVDRII